MGTSSPSPQQLELTHLVVNGFRDIHKNHKSLPVAIALVLFTIALGIGAETLLFACVHWSAAWFGHIPDWVYAQVGFFLLLPIVLFVKRFQFGYGDTIEHTARAGNVVIGFIRLEIALGAGLPALAFFLGVALGAQTGLMQYISNHYEVPPKPDWWSYLGLSLDNLFHGVVLYGSELFDLRLAPRINYTRQSALIFLLFRLAYDAVLIFVVVAFWNRRRVGHLINGTNAVFESPTPENLAVYLRASCYGKNWAMAYHDEFIFLCMVEKYVSGEYEQCRLLAQMFPNIAIPASLRALFVDPDGKQLL